MNPCSNRCLIAVTSLAVRLTVRFQNVCDRTVNGMCKVVSRPQAHHVHLRPKVAQIKESAALRTVHQAHLASRDTAPILLVLELASLSYRKFRISPRS